MMNFPEPPPVPSDRLVPHADPLRLALAAYLARFKGRSREHTESDLRCFLTWCAERGLDPLAARRPHLELYIRWMQEIRWFKPSAVSRRFSVAAGFYRTCVIDGVLEHSPAEHVRCPSVPAESPTNPWVHASAVRGPADRSPRVTQRVRLRAGVDARAARPAARPHRPHRAKDPQLKRRIPVRHSAPHHGHPPIVRPHNPPGNLHAHRTTRSGPPRYRPAASQHPCIAADLARSLNDQCEL